MKKQLKSFLAAILLSGLTLTQTAYGSNTITNKTTAIIRVNDDGSTTRQDLAPSTANEIGPGIDTTAQAVGEAQEQAVAQAQETAQTAAEAEAAARAQAEAEAAAQAEAEAAAKAQAEAEAEAARLAQGAGKIRQLDPSKPMIALTYDDGPQASVGNRIMDVMNQYGQKCTFFVVGSRVPSYATEMRRMADEGFEIANHTQDHKYLHQLSAAQIQSQMNQCSNIIESTTGVRPTIMRPPGGFRNSTMAANVGMPIIMWSIDTNDWKHRNTQTTVNAVLGKVKDGDIVLMHELYSSTAAATEQLVPALVGQGYQLVTVSELAHYKGRSLSAGQSYSHFR